MEAQFLIAGFGGQGVLLIGYVGFIIAAAVLDRKKALRGFST